MIFCSFFTIFFLDYLIGFAHSVNYLRPQPRIVVENGHLIFYAAEHKSIKFETGGEGAVHVNGIDITNTSKIVNSALNTMKKYQINLESSFQKVSRVEQLIDDGFIQRISTFQPNSNTTLGSNNSNYLIRRVRRLNRKVNNLLKSIKILTSLLILNECTSNPCKNGGTCQDLFGNFLCHCTPEWEGPLCDKDVNECGRFSGTDLGCQNGATCVNLVGSYQCICAHGWYGLHCTRRTTDCKSGSNAELCGHGTCVTQYDSTGYKCICDQGWTTDGKTPACNTDVNECVMNKPPCSVNPLVPCINVPGSFHCGSCPQGYSGNGYYCSDIDECANLNGGCSTNPMVQCINTLGSRICGSCPPGYSGDGITCSYEGICKVNNGGCHPLATCRSNSRISSTFVECTCPVGYNGNGVGPNGCVRSLQGPCFPNPCRYGTCRLNGTNDFKCDCYRRWTGRHCDTYVDLCASNPCQNGATCTSHLGLSYRCICPRSYTGLRCETEKQNCGGHLNSENGTLTFPTPQYQSYGNAMSCAWIIETNASKVLNITFSRFSVELSHACRYDWLQIHDGKNTLARSIGRFCGHDLPNGGNIISTHNVVYLWFRSDHSVVSDGFNLTWTSVIPYCGDDLKEVTTHGTIQSPGSPGNYPTNRDCYWPLLAPAGKRLLFHFFSLMIGNISDCSGDYLEFIFGTHYSDPVFAKYCNTTHPTPLFSPGAEVLIHFHSDATKTYPGFQITYSVVEGIPGCGGIYTQYQGEIKSPTYKGNYPNDILCEYKIELPQKARIKLTFLSFSLEDSELCRFDYVAIYAGSTVDDPLIGKYCGTQLPAPYIAENNKLLIVFKTDWATAGNGFEIRYERVCGGKFTTPTGVISSPGYPHHYDHSLNCIFEIIQPLGKVIKLQIDDLDIESNSQPNCVYDFLQIRDGHDENSTLVGTYCLEPPPMIVSTYNYLWIKFQSDSTNNGKGFSAHYTTTNLGCGGILKSKTGMFSSPNYPDLYPPGASCKWIIAAPPSHIIQILWMNFNIEKSFTCAYDFVEVFDNNTETGKGTSIGKFCGATTPPTLLSGSNLVTVVFQSDYNRNMAGFMASYNALLEANVCGGNYYTDAGTLKSPGYPDSYPLVRDCIWTINVKPGHQILLNVTDFSLEKYSVCRYDWLEIRNGGSALSPLLGKYCGTTIPRLIPSHANQLYLHFHSDMTKTDRGFKIHWEATATGCGGTLTGPTGSITSPNYPEPYSVNTECIWKITISRGSLIQVVFSDLDLEEHSSCLLDYVEILDGSSLNSKSLGKFCSSTPTYIRSSSNSLTVKFKSDMSRNGRGFQLQYTTMCNNTLKGFRGVIESPNFPNNYPSSANCNWEIVVSERNKINISFSHFDLERVLNVPANKNAVGTKCIYDYVEVLYITPVEEYEDEGPFEKFGTYCGQEVPPLITLNSNHAKIHFVSDNLLHGNGFRLEWQIEGCGDILTRPSGNITSPGFPKAYPPSIECQWKIEVDYGNQIEITFHKLQLEKSYICHLDYVTLYNGEDDTYPEIASICHQDKPITLRSSGNVMFIKFKADQSVQGFGFLANYTEKPTKCGGKYIADKANIISPNYPHNYETNDTCSYLIEIAESHIIALEFEDFDLYSLEGVDCSVNNNSYVKIYDGPSTDYPLLKKICGKDAPNDTIVSTTNKMLIQMVTQTKMTSKGFLAKYRRACGARIETDGTGFIKFTPNDINYEEYNCSWTILAKDPSKHVSLTVTHLDTLSFCSEPFQALKIYNGQSTDAPLLGAYCGTKIPPTLTSDGSALHIEIEFNSYFFATYSVYDSHCGGTLTSLEGFFSSPGYPKKYPIDTECEWTISVSEGNHVSLNFIDFKLIDSANCNTDYLEIRQNNAGGKHLGTFCGSTLPTNFTNMGSLWISFKTSQVEGDLSSLNVKGFYVEYMLNHYNKLSGPSGKIFSPHYFENYPLSGDFSWKITVDLGNRILLTFKDMFLEGSDSMCFSSLKVYDGSDDSSLLIGEYCVSTPNDSIKSSSNTLYISYEGYSTTRSSNRFALEWLQIANKPPSRINPKIQGCGSNETINLYSLQNYTEITSPGFPNGYAPNLKCEWILTTIPMNRLRFNFRVLDFPFTYGSVCYADYVEIFEKRPDSDWTSVIKACQENVTTLGFTYTTNIMKVVFVTNAYGNGTGFKLFIREDCGGILTDPSGYIIFNNDTRESYGSQYNAKCDWNITVRAGRTIELEFLDFDIHEDPDKGCLNYLLIRNGKFVDSPILGDGKYCGTKKPAALKTTGNNARIKYVGISNLANFKIRYREVSYACGGEILLNRFDNSTEIYSPNYPQIPPSHVDCSWRITAPPGETIRIDFPYRFDIAYAADCSKEYVEIRDGANEYSKLIGKFCGKKPNSQFTTDNIMFVKFFTQLPDPSNGFKAKIVLGNCGGTIHGNTGKIQSPYFNKPSKYPVDANCTWHLMAPLDYQMNIKFAALDLEKTDNCSADFVRIYEQNKDVAEVNTLGTFCGNELPNEIKSLGNEVLVNFKTSKDKKELKGFSLQYNASSGGCGGIIEATEGVIQSPGYPVPHKSYRRCFWYIKVPFGRRVTLTIQDFDMNMRMRKSWWNGLMVYNEDNYRGYIRKITESDKIIESCENHVAINYWSRGSSGRGFKLKFSSNEPSYCTGDLNQESGTITQPKIDFPSYCTYMRKNQKLGTTLSMTIVVKTNATQAKNKGNCYNYLLSIKVQAEPSTMSLYTSECTPSVKTIRSPFPNLKLILMQYHTRNQVNYTISYNSFPCGGILSTETGTITSPGYPNKYSKALECSWMIKLSSSQTILLTFEDLQLGNDCEKSYLDIYNGDPTSPKIDRYCQSNKPNPILSQRNLLWIIYVYDPNSDGEGFKLRYEPKEQGCGGVFHEQSRIIQSPSFPNDYPNNAECLWELRSDEGYHIGLIFTTRFQIEESDHCENDFVEIWDWKDNNWISLGKKCGREMPEMINSTGSRMRILFRSNERITGKGFKAKWQWNCGGTFIADNTERFIVSPGYPQPYKKNLNCLYNITSGSWAKYTNIKFYSFSLEGTGSNCKFDNLTISTGYNYRLPFTRKMVYCGQNTPPNVRVNNMVYIRFQTDGWVQKSGFMFSYQLDNCGGNISTPTTIKTPEFNINNLRVGLYQGYMFCTWNISAPANKTTVIAFQNFQFQYTTNCYFDNVEIFEGKDTSRAKRIANLCGNLNEKLPVIKSENKNVLMTLKTDRTRNHGGFVAEIFFIDGPAQGCGGKINLTTTQTLTAPDLSDMDCSWTVVSEIGTIIKVQIDEINLHCPYNNTNNCTCAFLEFRDGHPSVADIIQKLCDSVGKNLGKVVTSTRNVIGVRVRTRGYTTRAFKITLRAVPSACGPVFLNATNDVQILTSPGYPNKYPNDIKCSWIIRGNRKFNIHFIDFDLNEENDQHLLTNDCSSDKLEIFETSIMGTELSLNDMGPSLTVFGNKMQTAQFSRFASMTGTHQFCGKSETPFDYYSVGSSLVIKFTSGNIDTHRGRGFKLQYHETGCFRNYTSTYGRIWNRISENCYQTITVPENYTISIYFQNFLIYGASDCEKVGFEILEKEKDGTRLLRTCSYLLPSPVFSSSNKLWLHGWNKIGTVHSSYELIYTSSDKGRGCGGTLYDYKGIFTSPLHPLPYKLSVPCVWRVKVPVGMRVALKFTIFDIQGKCEENYVKVTTQEKEGGNDHKFCKNDNPAILHSNSYLTVEYQSSINNEGTGWSATFEATTP